MTAELAAKADGPGGEPEGHRGRRPVLHSRHEGPRRPLPGGPAAARAPRRGHPRLARLHPALARRAVLQAPTSGFTTSTGRPGTADAARDRRAGRQGREGRLRAGPGQAEPVHRPPRRAKSVNRELEAKARTLAGIKGYVTNLAACPDGTPVTADFVIGSYHRLFEIEKSKPQCCHRRGLSALSSVPSGSVFMLAA